jgi:hypothetical protein
LENGILRRHRGLSQVVTVLILLVVGVLLAAVVTYYASNITLTRTTQEEVRFSEERIWVNDTGAVTAFILHNVGGRDILVNGVRVRGIEAEWDQIYYYRVPSGSSITGDMNVTSPINLVGGNVTISGRVYAQADSDIPLISSGVILFYVRGPINVLTDDVGITVNLCVYTSNSQYITECNVESATQQ